MTWKPRLGAFPLDGGYCFRVWAPQARTVEVVIQRTADDAARGQTSGTPAQAECPHGAHARVEQAHGAQEGGDELVLPMERVEGGYFTAFSTALRAADRYRYRVDGAGPFPDPASRFQPEGVHGPSELVDPSLFCWTDAGWGGVALSDAIFYELHVGTFSAEGTFAGVVERLPKLVELGVTVLELMPLADFAGQRNWGYDGVSLFAPARCYGRPDDLRRLVNEAHRLGLGVILDVVYNHLGPDGNYLAAYSPYYFSRERHTAWGAGPDFDGPHSSAVREFFIENALYWLHEFHLDGLRLDATHTIVDTSRLHILAELAERVHAACAPRRVLLIAEDNRNLAQLVRPRSAGGWGLDAVWADDWHHQMRRLLAQDHEGYYRDYRGTVEDLAATIRQGWLYTGQHSRHWGAPRGTDPAGLAPRQFVVCLQNHDQVGNRALGERLHHQIDLAAWRAASALLMCLPQTPLLFMGQEWAATSPFLFFTDHDEELGRQVTAGRRREFRHFSAFADPEAQRRIPDPQAEATFRASQLDWDEIRREPHASIRRLYQTLLSLRRREPALRSAQLAVHQVEAAGADSLVLRRPGDGEGDWLIVVRLRGRGAVDLRGHAVAEPGTGRRWAICLTTEDAAFSPQPNPPQVDLTTGGPLLHFAVPAAVLLRERHA
ncbi:MAG: malto-oligosyltrehalose trehalohydrolase [Pirellulales bacterium]|nr:malto-oligosyltrehalose trehalohydrolase [Pirellulales bacterium]